MQKKGGGGVDQVGEGRGRNCGTRDPGREMRSYINTQPSPIVFVPNMLLHLRTLSKNRTNGPIVTRVMKPVTVWRLPEVLYGYPPPLPVAAHTLPLLWVLGQNCRALVPNLQGSRHKLRGSRHKLQGLRLKFQRPRSKLQ